MARTDFSKSEVANRMFTNAHHVERESEYRSTSIIEERKFDKSIRTRPVPEEHIFTTPRERRDAASESMVTGAAWDSILTETRQGKDVTAVQVILTERHGLSISKRSIADEFRRHGTSLDGVYRAQQYGKQAPDIQDIRFMTDEQLRSGQFTFCVLVYLNRC